MRDDVAVTIDSHYTLIYVNDLERPGTGLPGIREFERDGDWFQVIARPSAAAFIEALNALEIPVYVVSGGHTKRQRFCLNVADLARDVDGIFGVDNWSSLKLPKRFVHIDDSHPSEIKDKMELLNGGKLADQAFINEHFVQCTTFTGGSDHEPLTGLLQQVLSKLGLDKDGHPAPSS
jgi:hypothetical protein